MFIKQGRKFNKAKQVPGAHLFFMHFPVCQDLFRSRIMQASTVGLQRRWLYSPDS